MAPTGTPLAPTDDGYFVTHLECSKTGRHYPADRLLNVSDAGMPLLVRYDLDRLRHRLQKDALTARNQEMWRYRELLPMRRGAPRSRCLSPLRR